MCGFRQRTSPSPTPSQVLQCNSVSEFAPTPGKEVAFIPLISQPLAKSSTPICPRMQSGPRGGKTVVSVRSEAPSLRKGTEPIRDPGDLVGHRQCPYSVSRAGLGMWLYSQSI